MLEPRNVVFVGSFFEAGFNYIAQSGVELEVFRPEPPKCRDELTIIKLRISQTGLRIGRALGWEGQV